MRGILSRPCLLPRPAIGVRRANYSSVVSAAELRFGQPLHETHPHLLMPGERELVMSGLPREMLTVPMDSDARDKRARVRSSPVEAGV